MIKAHRNSRLPSLGTFSFRFRGCVDFIEFTVSVKQWAGMGSSTIKTEAFEGARRHRMKRYRSSVILLDLCGEKRPRLKVKPISDHLICVPTREHGPELREVTGKRTHKEVAGLELKHTEQLS